MEGFVEQVVKRDKTAKNLAIKIISVALLFLIPLGFVLLARVIPYMALVGFFIFIGGIYVVWWIFSSQKVEFEYSVNGDSLDVAKIISLRRRKKVCRVPIKDIFLMEKGDAKVKDGHYRKIYNAAQNFYKPEDNTFALFNDPVYGKCMLVFNPNEEIINAMRPYMSVDLIRQIFYSGRNV